MPKQRRKRRPPESLLPMLTTSSDASDISSARAMLLPNLDADPRLWRSCFIDSEEDDDSMSGTRHIFHRPEDIVVAQVGDKKQGYGRRRKLKENPFLDYDALEKRLQAERRWLQEDAEYMGLRTRGLQHNTVQERLGRKALCVDLELSNGIPSRGGGQKSRGQQQLQQQQAVSLSDMRRQRSPKHGESAALKSMQRELEESVVKVQKLLGVPLQHAIGSSR
eukprot:CAMPEP_0115308502 /NCGR_PEP_ID=MMETSP0270-20121206/73737_1 /TAXON_ID=71861 /ORGANISM="Scrippsiella trochoidea, Strain CCMP3099" /LENGTH=220 /DNA_ID=CAMNT_0002727073 /DNA_START=180 /DNA_END=842 /DNA_ORIENTATION=-